MKKTIILLISIISLQVLAQESELQQAHEFYKRQQYDLAEEAYTKITRDGNSKDLSMAYYYLGLSQYYKKDYNKAVSSLELSIDTSTDLEHDKKVEKIIERIAQIQSQGEMNKLKYSLGFTAGYMFDTNALNVAEDDENLNGHILNASAFFAYKLYQEKESSIEPMFYLSDSRTLDHRFESTEDIQAADATLLLMSVPYKTVAEGYRSATSINVGLYMLPEESSSREMGITLLYLKQNLGTKLTQDFDLDWQLIVGRDQSQLTFSNAEDNQTAVKFDLSAALKYSLPNRKSESVSGELGVILNDADGDNASYNKIYTSFSYDRPTWRSTYSTFKLNYGITDYNLSELGRRDKFVAFNYSLVKDLTTQTSVNVFASASRNDCTIDDYTYDDTTIGAQYIYLMRF